MKASWKLFLRLTPVKEFSFLNIPLCNSETAKKNSLGVEWTHLSSTEMLSFKFEENSFRKVLAYEKRG